MYGTALDLKPHCTTYSYLRPLYSKQCLIGACWTPMIPFFIILIESWFDEITTCQWPLQGVLILLAKLVQTGVNIFYCKLKIKCFVHTPFLHLLVLLAATCPHLLFQNSFLGWAVKDYSSRYQVWLIDYQQQTCVGQNIECLDCETKSHYFDRIFAGAKENKAIVWIIPIV